QRAARQHLAREADRIRSRVHRAVDARVRPQDHRDDDDPHPVRAQRILTAAQSVDVDRRARRLPAPEMMLPLQRVLVVAVALGLGFSIALSETALTLLTLSWLWRLRKRHCRVAARWPLVVPLSAWVVATLAAAATSGHATASLFAAKDLLLIVTFYVMADALATTERADRFLSMLAMIVAGAGGGAGVR